MTNALQKFRGLLLLIVALQLVSCQDDETDFSTDQSGEATSRYINLEELAKMPKALEAYEDLFKGRRQKNMVYDSIHDFYVNTDNILLMEYNDFHSLTFSVTRDSTSTVTENIVLNWEPYEHYKAYFAEYRLTTGDVQKLEEGEPIDLTNKVEMHWLKDFKTTSLMKTDGGGEIVNIGGICYEVTWVRQTTTSNIPGQKEFSTWVPVYTQVGCPEENPDYSFTLDENGGGGFDYVIPGSNPANFNAYNPGHPVGGGLNPGPGSGNFPFNPVMTNPILEILRTKKECEKITAAMVLGGLQAKVADLATKVNDPVNEEGFGTDMMGGHHAFTPGPEIGFPGGIMYNSISHTHNVDKLSVFSFSDFIAIAKLISFNNLSGSFIATLSTEKGTHYVMTINDLTKFKNCFYYRAILYGSISNTDMQEKYNESMKKGDALEKKYYSGDNPLIKVSETDNEKTLKHFLNFIQEADMGVTVFETDASFQNFTKVSTPYNKVKRSPCE